MRSNPAWQATGAARSVWFYSSKVFREQELARLRQTHPHIPILA